MCSSCKLSILLRDRDASARALESQWTGPGLESWGIMSNVGHLSPLSIAPVQSVLKISIRLWMLNVCTNRHHAVNATWLNASQKTEMVFS